MAQVVLERAVSAGRLELRRLRRRDARQWAAVRTRNAAWLAPWEATLPAGSGEFLPTFNQMVGRFNAEARAGRMLPLVLLLDGRMIGQVTVSGITYGSLRAATIGYWIDRAVAGKGLMPIAVGMVVDHCFHDLRLHRMEIAVRPENAASLRVVHKLGFYPEGVRRSFLHIDGSWRDHAVFALRSDQAPTSMADLMAQRHDRGARRIPGSDMGH